MQRFLQQQVADSLLTEESVLVGTKRMKFSPVTKSTVNIVPVSRHIRLVHHGLMMI